MNQILETKMSNGKNTFGRKKSTEKIFAVSMIIFALIIIGVAGFALYNKFVLGPKNKQNEPIINIEYVDDNNIKIIVEYDDDLSKVSYQWDDGDIEETITTGKKVQKLLQIPLEEGEHTILVKAYAVDDSESKLEKTFEREKDEPEPEPQPEPEPVPEYKEAPQISRNVDTINKLVNFIVTDDRGIAYLEYYWEGEDAIRLEPGQYNNLKVEASIDVNRGENVLTIKAVDIDGNETIKTATFKGLKVPEISAIKYDEKVKVTILHDMGFEKIEFVINGQAYIYDELCEGYNPEQTTLEYEFDLQAGENIVIVNAYSNEGTSKTYSGKTTN